MIRAVGCRVKFNSRRIRNVNFERSKGVSGYRFHSATRLAHVDKHSARAGDTPSVKPKSVLTATDPNNGDVRCESFETLEALSTRLVMLPSIVVRRSSIHRLCATSHAISDFSHGVSGRTAKAYCIAPQK